MADTTHNDSIPKESLIKIHQMLPLLLEIIKCLDKKDTDRYKSLVQKLPEDYQDNYHRLIQMGSYFIVGMSFAKRGREGKIIKLAKYFNKYFYATFERGFLN